MTTTENSRADALTLSTYCPHGIHWDNACGACNPSRGTKVRTASPVEQPAAAPKAVGKIETFSGKHGLTWSVDPESLPVGTALYADALPAPAQADARSEDAYVAKRLSEVLASVYATLIGDDEADADESLNAIERVERAAQVLRLEVELYRGQADARDGLTDEQRTTIQHAADKLRTVWANHTGDKESRELCHKLEAILAGANHAE